MLLMTLNLILLAVYSGEGETGEVNASVYIYFLRYTMTTFSKTDSSQKHSVDSPIDSTSAVEPKAPATLVDHNNASGEW